MRNYIRRCVYILAGYHVHPFYWNDDHNTQTVGLLDTSNILHTKDVPEAIKEHHVFNGHVAAYIRYLFESILGKSAVRGELSRLLEAFEAASRSGDMEQAIASLDTLVKRLRLSTPQIERPGPLIKRYENIMNDSNRYWNDEATEVRIDPFITRKYAENGAIRAIPGITSIQWVRPETPFYRQLSKFRNELRRRLARDGLLQYMTILSPDRFHMTIANIAVGTDRESENKVIEAGRNAFAELSRQKIPKLKMFGAGVSLFAAMSLGLRVHPLGEDDLVGVYKIRNGIRKHLPSGMEGDTARDWTGHITLAYIFKDIPSGDYEKLRAILREYENRFVGEIIVDNPMIKTFKDMERWSQPLAELPLHDPAMSTEQREFLVQRLAEARAAFSGGDLPQAQKLFEEMLANDPKNADALRGLVSVETRQGHGQEAGGYYQRLAGIIPVLEKFEQPMQGSNGYFNYGVFPNGLEISQGARAKYDEEGIAKDFPGISAVQWIKKGTKHYEELSAFAEKLKEALRQKNPRLLSYFSFLPANTYHMTLYDIDTWEGDTWRHKPWTAEGMDKNQAVSGIVGKVMRTAKEVFKRLRERRSLSAKMFTQGLSVSSGTSLVLRVHPVDEENLRRAVNVRDALKEALQQTLGVGTNNPFIAHISLVYLVKDIPEDDYKEVQEVLKKFENQYVGAFDLDEVAVTEFTSMADWKIDPNKDQLETLSLFSEAQYQAEYEKHLSALESWIAALSGQQKKRIFEGTGANPYDNSRDQHYPEFAGLDGLSQAIQQGANMTAPLDNGLLPWVGYLLNENAANQSNPVVDSMLAILEVDRSKLPDLVVSITSNRAMLEKSKGLKSNKPTDLGGIALNAKMLDLQIRRDGNGVPLPISRQPLDKINIQGFVPEIISIQPVDLPAVLGFHSQKEEEFLVKPPNSPSYSTP